MTDTPPTDCRNNQFFDRLNLDEVPLSDTQAHGGEGLNPEAKTDMTDTPPTDCRNNQFFDRLNLDEVPLSDTQAHGGEGLIRFARLCHEGQSSGLCHFIDLAEIPPGSSIGRHRHGPDEEEFYLVLKGEGVMWRNGEEFPVRAGDLIRNPPSGEHSLYNLGPDPLRIFVFEVSVKP